MDLTGSRRVGWGGRGVKQEGVWATIFFLSNVSQRNSKKASIIFYFSNVSQAAVLIVIFKLFFFIK